VGDVVILFGAPSSDLDGPFGQLTLVVADPKVFGITHVVVTPDDVSADARLVPIGAVSAGDGQKILLNCPRVQSLGMPAAVTYGFAPDTTSIDGAAWTLAGGTVLRNAPPGGWTGAAYEAIPAGSVGLRRDQPVRATDAMIGRLIGVVVDLGAQQLKRLILAEGHLFSKKNVSFEIDVIMDLAEDVRLNITKQQADAVARPY